MSKLEKLKVGNYVVSKTTGTVRRVIEVNEKWAWFRTDDNCEFGIGDTTERSFYLWTPEERADYLLALENNGITDYWMDS